MTHDYKPNGTASLFAGLEAAKGKVYGLCQNAIDTESGLSFCQLDQSVPSHLDLHLIGDNYATHKHP